MNNMDAYRSTNSNHAQTCVAGHWRFDANTSELSFDETLSKQFDIPSPAGHQSAYATVSLAEFIESISLSDPASLTNFLHHKDASDSTQNKSTQVLHCCYTHANTPFDLVMLKLNSTSTRYCSGLMFTLSQHPLSMQSEHNRAAARHAINTPLNSLQGALQMLKQMPLEPDAVDVLEIACESCMQISTAIQKLIR